MKGITGRAWNSSTRYHPSYTGADIQPLQELLGIQPSQMFSSEATLFGPTTSAVELQRSEENFLLQCDQNNPHQTGERSNMAAALLAVVDNRSQITFRLPSFVSRNFSFASAHVPLTTDYISTLSVPSRPLARGRSYLEVNLRTLEMRPVARLLTLASDGDRHRAPSERPSSAFFCFFRSFLR